MTDRIGNSVNQMETIPSPLSLRSYGPEDPHLDRVKALNNYCARELKEQWPKQPKVVVIYHYEDENTVQAVIRHLRCAGWQAKATPAGGPNTLGASYARLKSHLAERGMSTGHPLLDNDNPSELRIWERDDD